jgi:hypothetical protein
VTGYSPADSPGDRPTAADLRWQRLAEALPFEQVEATRRQAEGWRNALIAATALTGTVTVFHGRQDLSAIATGWRYLAIAALGIGFAALISASVIATMAAYGRPGERIWATGESLRRWSMARARRASQLTLASAVLCILGISLVVLAAGITALAPAAASQAGDYVVVQDQSADPVCGRLVAVDNGHLVLDVGNLGHEVLRSWPVADVTRVIPAASCPGQVSG